MRPTTQLIAPLQGGRRGDARRRLLPPARRRAGALLPYSFWRRFAEIPNVVAIKIAPFNRYQTIDVVRAVAEAGRDDIALYTGNDDNIVIDLLTPYRFKVGGKTVERRIVGGLLGPLGGLDEEGRRAARRVPHGRRDRARTVPVQTAAPQHRGHRRQRRLLRRRQRLRRLHRRAARGAAPPGAARRDLVPRPAARRLGPGRRRRSTASTPPTRT